MDYGPVSIVIVVAQCFNDRNVVNLTRKNIFFWGRGEAVWDKMCLLPSEGGNLTNAIVVPELPGSLIPLLFN